ncbi:hypothetical protein [uncultured Nostoc sp.]
MMLAIAIVPIYSNTSKSDRTSFAHQRQCLIDYSGSRLSEIQNVGG